MDPLVSIPAPQLNWFDFAAFAFLLLFAWQGYRRGALGWIAAIGASLLALIGAFVLAPQVAGALAGRSDLGRLVAERVAFVVLLFALRIVFGWMMGELVGSLRSILRALPPLGLVDHLLGVIPSVALGALLVAVALFIAMLLPVDRRFHDAAVQSYLGRIAAVEVTRAGRALPRGGLMSAPERILDVERALAAIQSVRDLGRPS